MADLQQDAAAGLIQYFEQGTRIPIVFVHGWCMSSAIWRCQQEAVAAAHRFLALDLRGHGDSGLPQDGLSGFSAYGHDVSELFERLDLRAAVLVGWSMGAQACLKAWPLIRERVAGLVLVGATPRFTAAPHFPHGLASAEAEGMRLKVRRNLERALDGFHRQLFVPDELNSVRQQQVDGILAAVRPPLAAAALEGLASLMEEEVLREANEVDCPCLILHGDQDRICLPAASCWLEQAIAASRRICYTGCGHAPFLSQPDRFNRDLLDFVAQVQRR